jgi:hypothetical protein
MGFPHLCHGTSLSANMHRKLRANASAEGESRTYRFRGVRFAGEL